MSPVSDCEEAQALEMWIRDQNLPATLGQFVAENADRYEDRIALNYFLDKDTISYGGLPRFSEYRFASDAPRHVD